MLKKIGMMSASILIAIGFNGCVESNIEKVKNGILDDYKGTTIGKAFDNWKSCQKDTIKWTEFEADNGTQKVEFSCNIENKQAIEKALNEKKHLSDEEFKKFKQIIDIKWKRIFQWTVNTDNTCEFTYIGNEFQYLDGKKTTDAFDDAQISNQIRIVYNNDMIVTEEAYYQLRVNLYLHNWHNMRK